MEAAVSSRLADRDSPATTRIGEAPTWILCGAIYAGWGLLTWFSAALPWWVLLPAGGWLVAWHGSFQHEALHGHPSRLKWLNTLLAIMPVGLWNPYHIYRDSHLAHHAAPALTCPTGDPESFYVTPGRWRDKGRLGRALSMANNTLAGRMILGPWLAVFAFWRREAAQLLAGDFRHARVWAAHLALCAGVLVWVVGICGMPAWQYVLLFAWPGLSLILVRSYLEHRPAEAQDRRTVIVEAGPLMSLLFLNNNLHAVHHECPEIPWWRLPGLFNMERGAILQRNGGYLFAGGYAEIARRYAFHPKDTPVHPG